MNVGMPGTNSYGATRQFIIPWGRSATIIAITEMEQERRSRGADGGHSQTLQGWKIK